MTNLRSMLIVTAIGLSTVACSKRTAIAPPPPANNAPVVAGNATAGSREPVIASDSFPINRASGPATGIVASAPATADPNRRLSDAQRGTLDELLRKLEDALFDYNEANIRPDASAALRDNVGVVRDILADYPSDKLLIEGHADERGSSEYNLALGNRRARAAQEFLAAMGIPATQLSVISLGEERPVCTDQAESCWQKNRRAHIAVAQ